MADRALQRERYWGQCSVILKREISAFVTVWVSCSRAMDRWRSGGWDAQARRMGAEAKLTRGRPRSSSHRLQIRSNTIASSSTSSPVPSSSHPIPPFSDIDRPTASAPYERERISRYHSVFPAPCTTSKRRVEGWRWGLGFDDSLMRCVYPSALEAPQDENDVAGRGDDDLGGRRGSAAQDDVLVLDLKPGGFGGVRKNIGHEFSLSYGCGHENDIRKPTAAMGTIEGVPLVTAPSLVARFVRVDQSAGADDEGATSSPTKMCPPETRILNGRAIAYRVYACVSARLPRGKIEGFGIVCTIERNSASSRATRGNDEIGRMHGKRINGMNSLPRKIDRDAQPWAECYSPKNEKLRRRLALEDPTEMSQLRRPTVQR
ncbi:hypothetical protein R3P38DRAFT_2778380 [Favolaschia claudopus]|uniref:Uncharacterized protein n=1 Tax=Favolaschia claudopus TaxID=2862362 RepID=A0AAW0BK48_9AGAR